MNYYQRRAKAFGYALKGLKGFAQEPHARIHLLVSVLVVSVGLWVELPILKWCIVLLCIALVIMAEILNSALERTVDLISPDKNPLAGKAKDLAAGAVLFVSIIVAIVGLIIFIPELIQVFT